MLIIQVKSKTKIEISFQCPVFVIVTEDCDENALAWLASVPDAYRKDVEEITATY